VSRKEKEKIDGLENTKGDREGGSPTTAAPQGKRPGSPKRGSKNGSTALHERKRGGTKAGESVWQHPSNHMGSVFDAKLKRKGAEPKRKDKRRKGVGGANGRFQLVNSVARGLTKKGRNPEPRFSGVEKARKDFTGFQILKFKKSAYFYWS